LDERQDREKATSAEGVRIIGAEEAQAALDAGQASGRRPEDELRFGDVPPAPSGPRPAHRFPLPDSLDPAQAVPKLPAAMPSTWGAGAPVRPDTDAREHRDVPGGAEADRTAESSWSRGAIDRASVDRGSTDRGLSDRGSADRSADRGEPGWTTRADRGAGSGRAWSEPRSQVVGSASAGWGPAGAPEDFDPMAVTGQHRLDDAEADDVSFAPAPSVGIPPSTSGLRHAEDVGDLGTGYRSDQRPGSVGYSPHLGMETGATAEGSPAVEETITVSGGQGTDLPHWADPPTGEVPRILVEREEGPDEMEAWRSLGSRGLRWRSDVSDWDDAEGLAELGDDETRVGALDPSRSDHSDMFSFDEAFEQLEAQRASGGATTAGYGFEPEAEEVIEPEEEPAVAVVSTSRPRPARVRVGSGTARGGASHREPPPGRPAPTGRGVVPGRQPGSDGRNVAAAAGVGVGLALLLAVCYAIGAKALAGLAAVAVAGCALEFYGMLQRAKFRPATVVGLVGSGAAVLAAYWRGPGALPVVGVLVLAGSLLWYLAGVVEARPLVNVAVTVLGFAWIGGFGAFAGLLLRAHLGSHLFLAAIIPTLLADIGAWFVGSRIGSRPLAPSVSPGKTWEGVLAGAVVALVAGAILGRELSPLGGLRHGVELGLIVAVVAPIGDLAQSMVKRDLQVKDSGSLLPGHGGLFDRFDAVLIALPATYYLASALHLIK
jgi:phosphatidate cytidylyltransferase